MSAFRKDLQPADRVRDLVKRMTLEEKIAQMRFCFHGTMADGSRFSPDKAAQVLGDTSIGAVEAKYMTPADCARFFSDLQTYVKEHTRLGIPPFIVTETLHGVLMPEATVFPQAIALASTWDTDLMHEIATVIAKEASSMGITQALAPDLDLAREPRWGRVEETYGEDPYLTSRMGVEYVRGLQGGAKVDNEHLVATIKHFIAHGEPEGGVNLAPVATGERQFRELYLKPFKAALQEANALSVMPAYSELDGVPCSASRKLMTDLLRGELGFKGYTFSDYGAITMLATFHKTAPGLAQAGKQALEAGMDLEAPSVECFGEEFVQLVRDGKIDIKFINEAVERILTVKFMTGLFDGRPLVKSPEYAAQTVGCDKHRALARKAAQESVILLKNEVNLLPLRKNIKSLAVIGPNAAESRLGDYSMECEAAVSPLEGIKAKVGSGVEIRYARGCDLYLPSDNEIMEAVNAAQGADAAVVFVGEASMYNFGVGWGSADGKTAICGEGYDVTDLNLAGFQQKLVESVVATGTPTIVVLINGRPLSVGWIAQHVPAILECWYPGQEGGHAIADILFGDANPSGKLPVSFPKAVGQSPAFYNHKPSARGYYHCPGTPEKSGRDYVFMDTNPLFEFGYGLSYTQFSYSELTITPDQTKGCQRVEISATVRNTGDREGCEVVQLFINDLISSVTTPVKALKGFQKISLKPGESRKVTFELPPEDLAFVDVDMKDKVESGDFEIIVGPLKGNLTVTEDYFLS